MLLGISLLCCTGILWVILGAVISHSAKKNGNLAFIQGGTSLLMMLFTLPWIFFSDSTLPTIVIILLPFAGAGNFIIFELMNRAMKIGPNGMIWAMIQCAFVMPFLMGIIFFDVPCPWTRIMGIVMLLTAMMMMGVSGKQNNTSGQGNLRWLLLTFAAFLLAGANQCCANLPSYLIKNIEIDNAMKLFRCGLSSCGALAVWLINGCFNRNVFNPRNSIRGTLIMAASTLAATICLYGGLDHLANAEVGAIGYPIAMGVTIASFQIYTAISLKEKITLLSAGSIILCLISIVVISL